MFGNGAATAENIDLTPLDELPGVHLKTSQHPAVQEVLASRRNADDELDELRQRRSELESELRDAIREAGRAAAAGTDEEAEEATRAEGELRGELEKVERQIERLESAEQAFQERLEEAYVQAADEISEALQEPVRERYAALAYHVEQAIRIWESFGGQLKEIHRRRYRRHKPGLGDPATNDPHKLQIRLPHELVSFHDLFRDGPLDNRLQKLRRNGYVPEEKPDGYE